MIAWFAVVFGIDCAVMQAETRMFPACITVRLIPNTKAPMLLHT